MSGKRKQDWAEREAARLAWFGRSPLQQQAAILRALRRAEKRGCERGLNGHVKRSVRRVYRSFPLLESAQEGLSV